MGWDKQRNLRVRGQLYSAGTVTMAAGGTLPVNQTFGAVGNVDFRSGTVRLPGGIGTAGVGTADLQRLVLSFGGGSCRLTANVGGTVYTFLGIAQP